MSTEGFPFDPAAGRARLLELVRARAFLDGIQVRLASGKLSDFYIDGKKITLEPEGLYLFARLVIRAVEDLPEVSAVGGLTLGADPIAAAVCALSHPLGRPLKAFIVRKEAKGHGTGRRIEGSISAGEKVVIVEDTITTGASCLRAIRAVEEAGAAVRAVVALVDREDPEADAFRRSYEVRPLFTITEIRQANG